LTFLNPPGNELVPANRVQRRARESRYLHTHPSCQQKPQFASRFFLRDARVRCRMLRGLARHGMHRGDGDAAHRHIMNQPRIALPHRKRKRPPVSRRPSFLMAGSVRDAAR